MSGTNTTYNIYQPKMNFGQALLGGMMQSLGMGGNCYGIGGGGMNSIWSMGNFGMYGGFGAGCSDYNAPVGYAVANALTGVLGQAINCYWGGGGGSSSSESLTPEQQIKNLDTKISELKSKSDNAENLIESKYNTALNNARNRANTIATTTISNLNKNINDLKAKISEEEKNGENKNELVIATLNNQIKTLEAEREKLNKELEKLNGDENVEGSIAYLEKQRNDAIEAKKAEFAKEIEKYEKEKKELNDKIVYEKLNASDGHRYQQLKSVDYDALFDKDNKLISEKVTAKAVRAAIQRYKDASTNDDKDKYKTQLQQLWSKLPDKEKNTTLQSAYDLICGES